MATAAQIPTPWSSPFGATGTRTAIPVAPLAPNSPNASEQGGFPPITLTPIAAGGIAPLGGNFNEAFFRCSSWNQWQSLGGPVGYNSTLSAATTGYPQGALLSAANILGGFWLSSNDNNVTDPDTGGGGWTFVKPASWGAILTGAGTANAITVTLSPAPLSLASVVGSTLKFTVAQANTGPATIAPNGLGTPSLVRSDSSALASGDLATGVVYEGIVVSTSVVQLVGSVASQIASTAPLNLAVDTSVTANLIVATSSPAITYAEGITVRVVPANNNTGATTFNDDGVGPIAVTRPNGAAVVPGDIVAGQAFEGMVVVAAGPVTTLQMLAWPQNAVGAANSITGSAHTYVVADAGKQSRRSNSGSAMVDLLPGATAGALPANWSGTVANTDATALLAIQVGAGSTLTGPGVSNGTIVLGPGQQATFVSTGTNYTCYGSPARAVLRANVTLFFAPSGSGGSDTTSAGITSGSPFLTGTHAYAWAQQFLDLAGFQLTISFVAAAYTTSISCVGQLLGQASPVIFQGAGSGSTSIAITGSSAALSASGGADVQIAAVTLSSTAGNCIFSSGSGTSVTMGTGIVTGAAGGYQLLTNQGGQLFVTTSYSISGGSTLGHFEQFGGQTYVTSGITITFTVASLFFGAFASADFPGGYLSASGITFAGNNASVTGPRFNAQILGAINTNGGGANYFPGNSAGGTSGGGQYV